MDPILFDFLKKIAFIGESGTIIANTKQIAESTGLSQQSVSRYLILLENEGYISRKRIKNGEEILLTEKTFEEFKREIEEISYIVKREKEIEVEGVIFSGMGEGSYYMSKEPYIKGVEKFLGFRPYPGTLNVKVMGEFSFLSDIIASMKSHYVEPFEEGGRKFGGIKILRSSVMTRLCGIVLPERTHYNGVLEVISDVKLRDIYNLKDGDKIKIKIYR